jgi:Type II CAAX prenyl endopeptidase Rce1-like
LPLLVLLGATLVAQLTSLALGRLNEEQGFAAVVLPSVLFLGAVTLPLAGLGLALGRQIGLGAPLLAALLSRQPGSLQKLRRDAGLATVLGLALGGMLLLLRGLSEPYLPPELPALGHRGAIGGLAVSLGAAVAEEVWFRLGLMTVLVWLAARLLGHREARPLVAWPIIAITAVGFGMAHLPQLMSYGAASPFAVVGTVFGNSVVGILFGWCYWRRSLVAAMIAHFSVDVVLHVVPALVQ